MKQPIRAVCFVLALVMLTIICLPLKSLNILASDTDLQNVTVVDDNTTKQYRTGAKTVEAFLKEQGITLNAKDQCDPPVRETINGDLTITIRRGITVYAYIDDIREKRKISPDTTVEKLMAALQSDYGVALLYDGDMTKVIADGDTERFTSWYSNLITVTTIIPFETMEIETTALLMDKKQVRQEGRQGEKRETVAVIYIGGKEVKREVVEETIINEPLMQIVDVGIGGKLGTTTDTSSPSFQYIQKMTMNASAYTAGFESTGKNPGDPGYGITRSGMKVQRGVVSVDPRVIPLGTRLYVEGYGYSLAADTGGGIVGNMIDLFYDSVEDALLFGRRFLEVYILD